MATPKEIELAFVCKFKDVKQLKNAINSELQEQYRIDSKPTKEDPCKREFRIRKTTVGDKVTYIACVKVRYPDGTVEEKETESNEDHFGLLKLVASASMLKRRFRFKHSEILKGVDTFWEIDVSFDPDTKVVHPWCRVELELPLNEDGHPVVPKALDDFPIDFDEVLNPKDKDEAVQAKITKLYDTYFLTKLVRE